MTLRLFLILLRSWAFVAGILLPDMLWAGQSLVLRAGGPSIHAPDLSFKSTDSWRLEFQIHDFVIPAAGNYGAKLFWIDGIGVIGSIFPDGSINLTNLWDLGNGGAPCQVFPKQATNVLVRMQRDRANSRTTCELWNYDSTGYNYQILPFGTTRHFNPRQGGDLGLGATARLAFLRTSVGVLPLGSKPPTTADGGDRAEYKFDGTLKDSSGRNHDITGPGAVFSPTPNQGPFALAKTYGAPNWSNWVSLRAGFPAKLDGRSSYSLADASSAVSYFWQQTEGKSTVTWTNRDSATPTMQGLIFGTYQFALRVTDVAGRSATSSLEAGATATDDNGVVINSDPNVDKLFGPMIAFGKNPWGFVDERAMSATRLRAAAYQAQGLNPPSWETPLPGKINYDYSDANGPLVGVLAQAVPAADTMKISVSDASKIDLMNLPVRILIGPPYGRREDIRICSATATTGPATLTVCYDGRGQANPQGETYRTSAQAWPAGTQTWQMRIKGTGTNFLSTLCAAGPGPGGAVTYTAGTLVLTPGSATVNGLQTDWSAKNGVYPNNYIVRVDAMHKGVPFVFHAYITAVSDSTHLVLAHPYPANADAGTYLYKIVQADTRYATLHYTRNTDGSDAQVLYGIAGCESPTDLYVNIGRDLGTISKGPQVNKQYSYMDGLGYASAFGANFYGEDLAHRALYYRSGWDPALQAARAIGDYYARAPMISGGDSGGIPLLVGGGVIGGFVSAILDSSHPSRTQWSDLRGFANWGSIGQWGCSAFDTRDSSYMASGLFLAAAFDPDATQRAKWKAAMRDVYNRELKCKQDDSSWSQGFLWGKQTGPFTVTNGSAVVTGNNIPQNFCFGIGSGMVTVTKGSAIAVSTDRRFVAGNKLVITATSNGARYVSFFEFHLNPDGTATMGALWPGDSGTFSYVIDNNDSKISIGNSNDDPQLTREWACTWNNSQQITLNRPWDGPTKSNAYGWTGLLAGYGQQPFMLGIKVTSLHFASLVADAALSANMEALSRQAATWIHDTGYDPVTHGLHYGRVYESCEPQTTPPSGTQYTSRTPICDSGFNPGGVRAARVLAAEASTALRSYYEANPSQERKDWGDTMYGSIWGNPNFTAPNFYSDQLYVRDENSDNSLAAYKWTGFFFGMGMAHQWPAVRLGGVAPARLRTLQISLNPGEFDSAQIHLTAPSGAETNFDCADSKSCAVQVDDRQGAHWIQIWYLSGGKVVSKTTPDLLTVPPANPKQANH